MAHLTHAIPSPQPSSFDPHPETLNLEPETLHLTPKPDTPRYALERKELEHKLEQALQVRDSVQGLEVKFQSVKYALNGIRP